MATWVITGANRGLGLEFAKQLLADGHTIIAGVRNPEAMDFHHEQMTVYQLDVASTTSVETFAKNVKSSVLIHRCAREQCRTNGRTMAVLGRGRSRPVPRRPQCQHHWPSSRFTSPMAASPR